MSVKVRILRIFGANPTSTGLAMAYKYYVTKDMEILLEEGFKIHSCVIDGDGDLYYTLIKHDW